MFLRPMGHNYYRWVSEFHKKVDLRWSANFKLLINRRHDCRCLPSVHRAISRLQCATVQHYQGWYLSSWFSSNLGELDDRKSKVQDYECDLFYFSLAAYYHHFWTSHAITKSKEWIIGEEVLLCTIGLALDWSWVLVSSSSPFGRVLHGSLIRTPYKNIYIYTLRQSKQRWLFLGSVMNACICYNYVFLSLAKEHDFTCSQYYHGYFMLIFTINILQNNKK